MEFCDRSAFQTIVAMRGVLQFSMLNVPMSDELMMISTYVLLPHVYVAEYCSGLNMTAVLDNRMNSVSNTYSIFRARQSAG